MKTMKCLIGLLTFGLAVVAISAQNEKPATLKFSDLQKYDPVHATFRIEGYVLDIYKCPPCPPQAMCKPCIPDNITLVDTDDWKDLSKIKRLRIYTEKTDRFELKKKYLVTVKVQGTPQPGAQFDSVDLISIENAAPIHYDLAPVGEWKGESNCTVPGSPCHNEIVIYEISKPGDDGMYVLQADKVVNGMREDMGPLNCSYEAKTTTLRCEMKNGFWIFIINGKTMTGELRLADLSLYRKISVTKVDHN